MIGSTFFVALVVYLSLLLGSFIIGVSGTDTRRLLPDKNPISLEVLLVAVPLLASLFMFAFSNSEKIGLMARSRYNLFNAALFLTMLLLVIAGASQVASLGDEDLAQTISAFITVGDENKASPASGDFSDSFASACSALQTFLVVPYVVVGQKFNYDTVLYFAVLCLTSFVLTEVYGALLDSRLGESVRNEQAKLDILLVEERIQKRILGASYIPLFTMFIAKGPSPQSVQTVQKGLICALRKWANDIGAGHRIVRILLSVTATYGYCVLLAGGDETEFGYFTGVTCIVLLILASIEVSWLKPRARSLGCMSVLGFGSALILYISLTSEYVTKGLKGLLLLVVIMVSVWVVRTFVSFPSIGKRESREQWLQRNLYVWRQFELSAVGQYGEPFKNVSRSRRKPSPDLLLALLRNQVAAALYSSQMKSDIAYRYKNLDE